MKMLKHQFEVEMFETEVSQVMSKKYDSDVVFVHIQVKFDTFQKMKTYPSV